MRLCFQASLASFKQISCFVSYTNLIDHIWAIREIRERSNFCVKAEKVVLHTSPYCFKFDWYWSPILFVLFNFVDFVHWKKTFVSVFVAWSRWWRGCWKIRKGKLKWSYLKIKISYWVQNFWNPFFSFPIQDTMRLSLHLLHDLNTEVWFPSLRYHPVATMVLPSWVANLPFNDGAPPSGRRLRQCDLHAVGRERLFFLLKLFLSMLFIIFVNFFVNKRLWSNVFVSILISVAARFWSVDF